MAALRYRDEHNKVGYLQKPKGSDDYHQVLDFLRASHIRYALTNDPIIFDSLVKQFWSTATLRSPELGPPAILATIDETPYTITEDSVRSQLQLADDGGIDDLPIAEIYSGMDNLGYVTEGKLTFYKNKFSPQWRFLVHTILHCLSTKSGSWDQFGSSLAVALICLSDGRKFNWSSYIFKGMVSNIGNAKKFLMYPRFLQTILGIETSFTRQYHVFKLSSKLFANMKLNFEGQPMQLLAAMLPQDQEGEGAGVAAQAVPPPIPEPIPEPMPEPDQPQDHLSTPPRQQTSDPIAPVFEHGQNEPLGGSFHASPPRSTQAPPVGHTSRGAEDLITLTDVSSVVSTLVQKVNSLETKLKDTKKLFKDVVGMLVKKVKAIEVLMDSQEGDVSYPLSVKLMERMLKRKLEIDKDVVGNDMTTVEQLIWFIKNQIAAAQLNFEGQPMKLLAAMLPQDQECACAGVAAQAVPPPIPEPIPEPMHEPDQPQDHLSTPPKQQTSDTAGHTSGEVGDNEQYLGTVHWREKGVYVCLFEGAGERFVELAKQALQDLVASISLMPYTMYKKLGLGEPKATRMSLELADRSIQYPRGIIENMLIKVDKFILPIDFVILDMPEDSRAPIILGRPFLATARAMIGVFNKKITLRVGDDEVIFDVDQSIKRPTTEDNECYRIDDLDEPINKEAQELLTNEEPDSFLSRDWKNQLIVDPNH
ncbi:synaptobrevin, longin-like domain protein [Tanacetum coccineum]